MEDDYYKKPGLSNSLLGRVKTGTSFKCSEDTLDFGRQLHEACLEPSVYDSKLHLPNYIKNIHFIHNMSKAVKANDVFKIFSENTKTEYEKEYFFNTQEVDCKLKADLVLRKTIGDIKTTDARTREEFAARAIEYGYNRQGAFYLDGANKDTFIIIAVCKKYPHPTFTYVLDRNSQGIEAGRAEYLELIEKYKSLSPEQINALKS